MDLQALIDESLEKGGRQGIQARRDSLKNAVEASTVMLDAEGRVAYTGVGGQQDLVGAVERLLAG